MTRPLARTKPDEWAAALIEAHVQAYVENTGSPPNLHALRDRLRLLVQHVENRVEAFEGSISREVPD